MSHDTPLTTTGNGRSPPSERARRKKIGIVYTPEQIADYIAGQSISEAISPTKSPNRIQSGTRKRQDWRMNPSEKLSELRILDPACGEGVFLLAAAKHMCLKYTKTVVGKLTYALERTMRERIVTDNLFGFDTDEQAVTRCRNSLARWVEIGGRPGTKDETSPPSTAIIATIQKHVRVADALIEPVAPASLFDVVICNPPYVTMTSIPAERKEQYAQQFSTYHANGDLYYIFIERVFSLLKPGGHLGAIVPRYFLKAPTAERLRGFLATKRCRVIDDLGQTVAFPGVGIHATLLFFENRPPEAREKGRLRIHPKNANGRVSIIELDREEEFDAATLGAAPWTFQSPAYQQFITQVRTRIGGYLADYCTLAKGVQTGKDSVFVVSAETVATRKIELNALRPWLKGRDVCPFILNPKTPKYVIFSTVHEGDAIQLCSGAYAYLQEHEAELRQRSRIAEWYQWRKGDERVTLDWGHMKIVGRYKGPHPVFALDPSGAYFSQDVVLVQPKPGQEKYLHFFLALLNSPVVARIAQHEFKELAYHMYEWYPQQLARIPVIIPESAVLGEINDIVYGILENAQQDLHRAKLNSLITNLYEEIEQKTTAK